MAGNTSGVVWIGQRAPVSDRFAHVVFSPPATERFSARTCVRMGTPQSEEEGSLLPGHAADFLDWLFASAGLDWRAYRAETLRRRLASCLRSLRVHSVGEARRLIEREPQRRDEAINAILIGVTSFFRDERVFEALATSVLPQLLAHRGAVYVWSAGCSDGAELYSLAMLLDTHGWLSKSYLLGTDCRAGALRTAKEGRYQSPGALCAGWASRYFERTGDNWRVCPPLRQALRWRHANLLAGLEPGLWDLILFRNTAIYLRPEVSDRLWRQFENALRPGGVLMLGKAERPTGAKRLEPIGPCLYQRSWR